MASVLIVDDEPSIRTTLGVFLKRVGHDICVAGGASEAAALLAEMSVDVAIVDVVLGDESGLGIARRVGLARPNAQVILITGEPGVQSAREAIRLHAFDYIVKPVGKEQIVDVVNRAADERRRRDDYDRLQAEREAHQVELKSQVAERSRELVRSERRLRTLMDNLPGMAYRCPNRADWPMEFVSQGSLGLTGYGPDELTGADGPAYGDLIHSDDRQSVWDNVQRAVQQGVPFVIEYRLRDKEGNERWVWERGRAVDGDEAGTAVLEGFVTDITERIRAERALKESADRFRSIAENAADFIFIKDGQRRYTFVNPAMQKLLGLPEEEILGRTPEDIFGPEQAGIIRGIDDRAFEGETVNETRGLVIDGRELLFNTVQTPLAVEHNEVTSIMGIVRDVTAGRPSEESTDS
jgi:PAS domain S-box-containing protein